MKDKEKKKKSPTTKSKEKGLLKKISLGFKKTVLVSIILNIIFLIFGIIIYLNPLEIAQAVGILIGIYFIISGLFNIYEYFMSKIIPIFNLQIILGILLIILGIFTMLNPFKIIKIITFTLGIYLILLAIFKTIEAFKLKKYKFNGWILMFVISLLLLIFGIFITINPMASMDIIEVAGIYIILTSILEVANLFMLYSRSKEITKLFK